ncbi:transposase, partial [Corynebacterium sanguinis]|uniref:transposase n=1 Tax=Corynebacterium sanguinis TaxID=2594913 RepID=UPI0021AE551C
MAWWKGTSLSQRHAGFSVSTTRGSGPWPNSMVQTCIVHLIRAANRWVSYQDRKPVSSALREVYTAPN